MLNKIIFNVIQVLVVMAFAPLIKGILARLKENVQSKRGPVFFSLIEISGSCFTKMKSFQTNVPGFFASHPSWSSLLLFLLPS